MTEPDTKEILDIVIRGGRVMDPLTRTDVFADVGVRDGVIAAVYAPGEALSGDVEVDATGLVVAPGFINIHGHEGDIDVTMDVSVRDGVTTVIGGNCGARWATPEHRQLPMADYFAELEGRGIVANYAGFSGHNTLRDMVGVPDINTPATAEQQAAMVDLAADELEADALGVSYGPFYNPGVSYEEMAATARRCAEAGGGMSIHARYDSPVQPDPTEEPLNFQAFREGIRLARESGAPMILSHNGGPNFGVTNSGMALQHMITAMEEGVRLISDVHPCSAFNTLLAAPVFQDDVPIEDQLAVYGRSISDICVMNTVVDGGEVLMASLEPFASIEQFVSLRDRVRAGALPDPLIIGHFYPSHMIRTWMESPHVMIESDGLVEVDEATVIDRAGYAEGESMIPPDGIPHVIVNGTLVVSNGELTGDRPGRVLRRTKPIPGEHVHHGVLPGTGVDDLQ